MSPRIPALLALEDGSLIVGGEFTTFDGIQRNGLVRLVPRPVQPLAPPRLTSPGFVGDSFAITVITQAGHDYQLEYRDALESGTWQSLPPVAGDGTARVLVDPAPPATARFYRVTAK